MSDDRLTGAGEPADLDLPPQVSAEQWAYERKVGQNPRIRSYLGCTRMIEEVLDSNYVLLNCSPERLRKIWQQVRKTSAAMRSELAPTIAVRSSIPELEAARDHAQRGFEAMASTLLTEIDSYPERVPSEQLGAVRQLLCRSIGQIYAFLRDSFGEVMAADPRSRHEADYFLSKRFAQDIEASEWLYSSVFELCDYLDGLEKISHQSFKALVHQLRQTKMVPSEPLWEPTERMLVTLRDELAVKLREVVSLRAIRVDDLQALDRFATGISYHCHSLLTVCTLGREIVASLKAVDGERLEEREQNVKDLLACHEAVARRMFALSKNTAGLMSELSEYVPRWLAQIEKRRALMWSKVPDARERESVSEISNPEYFRRRFDD